MRSVGQEIIERLKEFNAALAGKSDKRFRTTTMNRRTGVTVSQYRRVQEILAERSR